MKRISIFWNGGADEAEQLAEEFADRMKFHTELTNGLYMLSLSHLELDDDELIETVMDSAYMALFGPFEVVDDDS
jgi:hypothetical protein